jgi:hypothetical protein
MSSTNNALVTNHSSSTQEEFMNAADVKKMMAELLAQQKAELQAEFEAKLHTARVQAQAQASVKIPVRVETSLTRKFITLGVKGVQTVAKPVEKLEVFGRTKLVESALQALAVSSDKVYDVTKKLATSCHTSADARKSVRVQSEQAFQGIQDAQVALKAAYEAQMLQLQAEAEAIARG